MVPVTCLPTCCSNPAFTLHPYPIILEGKSCCMRQALLGYSLSRLSLP